jgi:hypothetical protein
MRRHSRLQTSSTFAFLVWLWGTLFTSSIVYAQPLPTPDQLDQLLAPIALFPDALVAQICAASTDPQQILEANAWVQQNLTLTGQARTDAAQAQGFDPAFISLVNFAQVLDTMARNINDYAAIGQAFKADQGIVMDSIQRLRQQAFAAGALQSSEFQTVNLQDQGASQVVVIQPANPQVVFVPQYNPQTVFVQPDASGAVAASLVTFGAGVALGSYLVGPSPWAWGGWGWNWGRRSMVVGNNVWIVNNRYRPRRPPPVWGPPMYNRPVWVRPPHNWHSRPFYRPPPPGFRPPPPAFRPPPPRPPVRPVPPIGSVPPARPPASPVPPIAPPSGSRPPGGGSRPPGTGNRPPGSGRPEQRPPSGTGPGPGGRPQRPRNPYAGYPGRPGGGSASGGRPGAFGGSDNAAASREASNRGRASVASEQRQQGGRRR